MRDNRSPEFGFCSVPARACRPNLRATPPLAAWDSGGTPAGKDSHVHAKTTGTSLAQVAAGTDVAGHAAHEHISQPKENDKKRIITGLLGGAAMLGRVSTAQAQFGSGLFDTNRDTFVNPVEFGIGLGRGEFFGGNEGFFDAFDADDSSFLGLNASLRRARNPMPPGDRVRPLCPLRWDDKAPPLA